MTELKIKQADINNNGNQRLTGETGGRGETQNMYHILLAVVVCESVCARVGGWVYLFIYFFTYLFIISPELNEILHLGVTAVTKGVCL